MAIGDYTKTAYINGTSPALNQTNLNNNEDKLQELDDGLADGSVVDLEVNRKRIIVNSLIFGI